MRVSSRTLSFSILTVALCLSASSSASLHLFALSMRSRSTSAEFCSKARNLPSDVSNCCLSCRRAVADSSLSFITDSNLTCNDDEVQVEGEVKALHRPSRAGSTLIGSCSCVTHSSLVLHRLQVECEIVGGENDSSRPSLAGV